MMQHIADGADHIYLAMGATDFRKQQSGLTALVALKFRLDVHSGTSVFLFCNKKHNALRALRWDKNGFILATKTLADEMKFQWPKTQTDVRDITDRQLAWLLEGLSVDQKKALKPEVEMTGNIY
ncbi:MAG: IS66 family insertion sequence element accessory protein TnpB [Saccharofermentanales bacterium]